MNIPYTDAERFTIRRMFNRGFSDREIATALQVQTGRVCGWEAIRKQRRIQGLKKVPSYARWQWCPEGQQYLSLSAAVHVTERTATKLLASGRAIGTVGGAHA